MKSLKITFRDDMPLREFANTLNCISELYSVLSMAYNDSIFETDSPQVICNLDSQEFNSDLNIVDVSSGSIVLELARTVGADKVITTLVDWLRVAIDPYQQRKKELEIKDFDIKIKLQETISPIEISRAGIALINEALDMHDHMIRSNFPEYVAKDAFYKSIRCVCEIKELQEQKNNIVSVELMET